MGDLRDVCFICFDSFVRHDIIGCSQPVRSPDRMCHWAFPPTLYASLSIYYHLIFLLSGEQQWAIFCLYFSTYHWAGKPVERFVLGLALTIQKDIAYNRVSEKIQFHLYQFWSERQNVWCEFVFWRWRSDTTLMYTKVYCFPTCFSCLEYKLDLQDCSS